MAFNNNGDFVSGAEVRRKKPVGIIAGICALVIVGGGALAYNFVPVVKNTVRMAVMKPDKYFSTVETENLRNTAGNIAENYKKTYDYYNADVIGGKVGFSADLAEPYELGEGASVDSIGGIIDFSYNGELVGENISLSVNGNEAFNVEGIVPLSGTDFFMKIAGLSDDFIKMDAEEYYNINLDELSALDYSKFEPAKLENTINKYGDIMISYLADNGEISIEKGCEGTAADVSYTYNKIEIEINEKIFYEAGLKVLEELKDDSDIKEIYDSYIETYSQLEDYEEDDFNTVISDAIEDAKSEIETADEESKGTVAVYVDPEGTVRGHEFRADDGSIGYSVAKDGNTYGIEFVYNDNGDEDSIKINANEDNGAFTGVCNIVSDSEDFNFGINFDNLKIENQEEGLVSGTLSMDLSSVDESMSDFKINLAVDGSTQKVNFSVPNYIDDLGIEWTMNKNPEIPAIPDKSINMEDITDEQGEKFIKDIFEKIGWDYDAMYGGYDDYDDYDYDDLADYNYDDTADYDYDDTADYDDSYDYYEVDYKLADAEIKINDTPVLMPASMPEIYNMIADDEYAVMYECDENATMAYSGDQSLSAIFSAGSDSVTESTPAEYIEYIHPLGQTPVIDISINGITVGSSVSAVAEAFGLSDISAELEMKALDASEYYLYIYDTDNPEYSVILGFENNMVTYIALDYSELF